tara:strand:+ start:525 stop:626 length:102 start_codon:yes stop_codon:yes gene_type:complete
MSQQSDVLKAYVTRLEPEPEKKEKEETPEEEEE